eukprot:CAMPEP_0173418086 /NCGR_PEP_ID=MMETSP1357-20121228/317_1 /TAXON_ID=77926 /ORGANISM="Hemiselmis rufescens, Strain PCC563" /LENGTH=35 /DNA_ID= /DNA_START= /DNA_END= /DNA_ORIENTATION=
MTGPIIGLVGAYSVILSATVAKEVMFGGQKKLVSR